MLLAAALWAAPAEAWQMRSLGPLGADVGAQINRVRAEHELAPLRTSGSLRRAAAQHVYEMAVLGYFGHESPNHASLAARLADYYTWHGYATWRVGETLLRSEGPLSPDAIVRLWLRSPEHRRQLLDPSFREIGIDAGEVEGTGGVFGGRNVTIVAAEFGVRH
jgi:uncharacterized protein YkwD